MAMPPGSGARGGSRSASDPMSASCPSRARPARTTRRSASSGGATSPPSPGCSSRSSSCAGGRGSGAPGGGALDGTKIKANASKHKAMSYARMPEREAALAAKVAAILAEAEATDAAEDAAYGDERGDELPPGLRTHAGRLEAIREAKAALEAEAKVRTGDAAPEPKAQRNFTDPESRMMRSRPDGWVQAYNVGAVVDDTAQVIVATVVT